MSDAGFGLGSGNAVDDTSSEVAAAPAWGESQGNNDALALATVGRL